MSLTILGVFVYITLLETIRIYFAFFLIIITSRWGSIIWFVSSKLCALIEKACLPKYSKYIRFGEKYSRNKSI